MLPPTTRSRPGDPTTRLSRLAAHIEGVAGPVDLVRRTRQTASRWAVRPELPTTSLVAAYEDALDWLLDHYERQRAGRT